MEPDATEQGVQRENHHVSIDKTPQVHHYRDDSEPRNDVDDSDAMVYASFTLQNINAPVPPKSKHNNHILRGVQEVSSFLPQVER